MKANRIVDCFLKKCIGIINSKNWLSNFTKDVTIRFLNYCGCLFDRICNFLSIKIIEKKCK